MSLSDGLCVRSEEAFYEATISDLQTAPSGLHEDNNEVRGAVQNRPKPINKRTLDSGKDYREDSLDSFKGKR